MPRGREPRREPRSDRAPEQGRAAPPSPRADGAHILALQRSAGNLAVTGYLRSLARDTGATQGAGAAALPSTKRFKELWTEFEEARRDFRTGPAADIAKQLAVAPFDFDDLLEHGIEVVDWLVGHGEAALSQRMLDEVRNVWMIKFVSKGATLPARSELAWSHNDPDVLIARGTEAARAGKHEDAFRLLGVANELLSYYALEATTKRSTQLAEDDAESARRLEDTKGDPDRQRALQGATTFPRMIARGFQYSELTAIYDAMRRIYAVYATIEREALEASDAPAAAEARAKGDELRRELKARYTWGGEQPPGSMSEAVHEPVEIAEVSYTDTRRGPGLTLHGANSAETDLTALPGLPPPKEIGNNVQVQNLGALQDALMRQTDVQAELAREPEIRKAFGGQPVDLTDARQRQRAWAIMYGRYREGGAGALGALMALIGRYLKAYTVHTSYNVRDWGTSYLDSKLPTDLAGRAEQDCGVYALTVAWDVYETVKRADAALDVHFELHTMLDHVTLVIDDRSAGEHYLVNNDSVSPPHTGDPLELVAPQYGAIRGLPHTVGPSMTVDLGSTKDPEKRFHDAAWERYLASVDWGLDIDIPADVRKLKETDPAAYSEKLLELEKQRYQKFYAGQELFDRKAKELDALVSSLPLGDGAALASALEPVVDRGAELARLFVQLGPSAGVAAGSAKSLAVLGSRAEYLFTMAGGHAAHPLARVGRAVLHLKSLGTSTTKGDAVVGFCDNVPQFHRQLDEYRAAGAKGPF